MKNLDTETKDVIKGFSKFIHPVEKDSLNTQLELSLLKCLEAQKRIDSISIFDVSKTHFKGIKERVILTFEDAKKFKEEYNWRYVDNTIDSSNNNNAIKALRDLSNQAQEQRINYTYALMAKEAFRTESGNLEILN